MSVRPIDNSDGTRSYEVRYRDASGRNRSKTFRRSGDADTFDRETKRAKQLGTLHHLVAKPVSLDEYVETTWAPTYAAVLEQSTQDLYTWLYDVVISPTLGGVALHELTPELISSWQAAEVRRKRGREQIRKAHTLLGNILQRAVDARRIPGNPQRLVRKVKPAGKRRVVALAPASVEAVRRAILDGKTTSKTPLRDATLISVMAYAGLRPSEPFQLRWRNVGDRTLYVAAHKNVGRPTEERWVRLLAPLAADLKAWRLACGRPADRTLVFPGADGDTWTEEARKSWARRTFAQAVKAAKVEHLPPKDLRHAFASLLAHEGRSGPYIADQLGHGLEVSQSTYQHILRELEDQPRIAAEDAIRAAREARREARSVLSGTD